MRPAGVHAAIHWQNDTGDVLGCGGTEEQNRLRTFLHLTQPPYGNGLEQRRTKRVIHASRSFELRCGLMSFDHSWSDGIDVDAMLRDLHCEDFGEHFDTRLRRTIGCPSSPTKMTCERRRGDNPPVRSMADHIPHSRLTGQECSAKVCLDRSVPQ